MRGAPRCSPKRLASGAAVVLQLWCWRHQGVPVTTPFSGCACTVISRRLLRSELIFRLLLKMTVGKDQQ